MCYSFLMRLAALTCALLLAGCHASSPAPAAGGLVLDVALADAPTGSAVAIASVSLHLSRLAAVSDRSADDARATVSDVALMLGDHSETMLPTAPPGLYSAVGALLGDSADIGIDIQAVWNSARVHATLTSQPFDVDCAAPVRLDPGQHARLSLRADPASWFAGLDLSGATSDTDDAGIVVSDDDNRPLAAALLGNAVASFTLDCTPQ
jgi:hypothetical protein